MIMLCKSMVARKFCEQLLLAIPGLAKFCLESVCFCCIFDIGHCSPVDNAVGADPETASGAMDGCLCLCVRAEAVGSLADQAGACQWRHPELHRAECRNIFPYVNEARETDYFHVSCVHDPGARNENKMQLSTENA